MYYRRERVSGVVLIAPNYEVSMHVKELEVAGRISC